MGIYYEDDFVTLYHGDCLTDHREWVDADVLVTDPPYGMNYDSNQVKGRNFQSIANDHDTAARDTALRAWGTAPALVFGTWRVTRPAGTKQLLVWDKGNVPGMGDVTIPWGNTHEDVYVLGEWPPIKPGGRKREGGTPARSSAVLSVGNYNTQSADRPYHPTPKPAGLMEMLIAKCPAGVIADPFAGSGATLVAAKNLGRCAIGVEMEERYCETIAKRLSQDLLELEWTA